MATEVGSHLTPSSTCSPGSQQLHQSGKHALTQPRQQTSQDLSSASHQTVFFGESSPLTVVIDEGRRSPGKGTGEMHQTRLHYPIPDRLAVHMRDEALRAYKMKQEEQLRAEGAFSYPPPETCDILLQAYFSWFHLCFPILDRAAVHQAYVQGTLSPLLLQSMLFIGVSLCTDEAFACTEFSVRYWAKFLFYNRAKALYDADWESNKTVKVQSLFLLSFWRGGPSEERDLRFWLGSAISLAQKRGMHLMCVSLSLTMSSLTIQVKILVSIPSRGRAMEANMVGSLCRYPSKVTKVADSPDSRSAECRRTWSAAAHSG